MQKQMNESNVQQNRIKEIEGSNAKLNLENINLKEMNSKYLDVKQSMISLINSIDNRLDMFCNELAHISKYVHK